MGHAELFHEPPNNEAHRIGTCISSAVVEYAWNKLSAR